MRDLVYRICNYLREKLKLLLTPLKYLSISIDGWKARSNFNFLMMTAHWITKEWEPKTCTLAVHPLDVKHTAENLAARVKHTSYYTVELMTN